MTDFPTRFVCVDTEFLRETTYWPILCLVQLGYDDGRVAILDPIAGDDLTELKALLADPTITKVFHAGKQDMEIFVHNLGVLPTPVFDTQIAAQAYGYADQVSYAQLVRDRLGLSLDKAQQFTDWSRRPLKPEQLEYAAGDVIHLRELYKGMLADLGERHNWVADDMAEFGDAATYAITPETQWERVKIRSDKPVVLNVLRALATWRENEAMRLNQPRGRILKDDTLAELALTQPKTLENLGHVRLFPKSWLEKKQGEFILGLIRDAAAAPREDMPKREPGKPMPPNAQSRLELLKLLAKLVASDQNVSSRLLASHDDLEALARGDDVPNLTTGWRGDIFGKAAIDLLAGKLFMGLSEQGKILLRHDN